MKHQRRQRRTSGHQSRKLSYGFSGITIAAMCTILRTSEAFQTTSINRISLTEPKQTSLKRLRRPFPPSSSSLYVLSSPRRRTGSDNNNININSPIEFDTNLLINFNEISHHDSHFKTLASMDTTLPPLIPSDELSLRAPQTSLPKKISTREAAAGAASKSSLFRRQHLSAVHKIPPTIIGGSDSKIQSSKIRISKTSRQAQETPSETSTTTEVKTVEELDKYWPRCLEEGEDSSLPQDQSTNADEPLDYRQLLRGLSIKGDTQIIGSKDHPDFVHPVVKLMHERKRQQENDRNAPSSSATESPTLETKKKDKIALVVEGGGMRGCVSAGMVCAIHCLGLSDTIDVVYGSSAGAVVATYFVSRQLPYFGLEVYYDALTTMEDPAVAKTGNEQSNESDEQRPDHAVDQYDNDYFIDEKRMTRSMGLGLFDPRLLKDVLTRRIHGKPMMNLHYMFQNVILKKKPLDFNTFVKRQSTQPLKVVATGLTSEKAVVLSHEGGHFDTVENLCDSLHASCLLPGIAGPPMNVLKRIGKNIKSKANQMKKPNFVLRNTHRESHLNDDDYEPLGDAMLSAPIPYDIAHEEGATHVLVIRSSADGCNLMEVPPIMAWIGSRIFKRYFLKKNHLPGMYKRADIEQRHQRVYANTILELNKRVNSPPPSDSNEDQTMTIALEPGSEDVSHLETTREGIFKGVRQGFARAYDALVEDPAMRGKGKEMALLYFPDEILDYDPNDSKLSSSASSEGKKKDALYRSAFEEYLSTTGVVPKTWRDQDKKPINIS